MIPAISNGNPAARAASIAKWTPLSGCFAGAPGKTSWLRVTPPESGTLEVALMGQSYDFFGDSSLVVTAYAESAGALGAELACGLVPRDLLTWRYGSLSFPATAGATYLLQVAATGNAVQDGGYTVISVALRR